MRKIFTIHPLVLSAVALAVTLATGRVRAEEGVRELEQNYQFDERGGATIEWKFKLNATQWAMWKARYGDHPDLLLRIVKHDLAAAVIDDYALEKDEMHRTATSRFKARALAKYRSGGKFEIEIPKNMKLVTGSGQEWIFNASVKEEGGILNVTYRAKLPSKASDAHMVNGNDFIRLTYSLDLSPSRPKTLLWLGILVLLAAAGVGAIAFRPSTPATSAA
jgi:hypothetical protein